jgi:predicted aspartyl protease
MGEVRTEITLVNLRDAGNAQSGFIPETEIRRLTVNAVVDTGARTGTCGPLVINEETREKLGLRIEETGEVSLAGGIKAPCRVTETVKIYWKDRRTTCEAVVIPDEEDVLLGAGRALRASEFATQTPHGLPRGFGVILGIHPMRGMDVMVHPKKQEVVGAHGDKVRYVVK